MPARFFCLFVLISAIATAEIATRATTVHVRPDSGSAVIVLINAGERLPEPAPIRGVPSGWTAVSVPGPHEVYVHNRNITKDLDVKPGSPLHVEPDENSPVLTNAAVDDKMEITNLRGRWTQMALDQPITGYIFGAPVDLPRGGGIDVVQTPVQDTPITGTTSPALPPPTGPGEAVKRTTEERQSLADLPRLFEGVLRSTRVPLRPRRPYDFALETEDGTRFAYLNLTRILLRTPVENYLNRNVVVYGVAKPIPDTNDIVIAVESVQLR